ncbi:hypothetical protein HNV12_00895 [Methanococcoides sp. SA1]|nr:hypothetical protein [Methanococcoides sp. SA1]
MGLRKFRRNYGVKVKDSGTEVENQVGCCYDDSKQRSSKNELTGHELLRSKPSESDFILNPRYAIRE